MNPNLSLVTASPEILHYEYSQGPGIAARHAQRNPRWWPVADAACKVSKRDIVVWIHPVALTVCLTCTSLYSPACPALRQVFLQAFLSETSKVPDKDMETIFFNNDFLCVLTLRTTTTLSPKDFLCGPTGALG